MQDNVVSVGHVFCMSTLYDINQSHITRHSSAVVASGAYHHALQYLLVQIFLQIAESHKCSVITCSLHVRGSNVLTTLQIFFLKKTMSRLTYTIICCLVITGTFIVKVQDQHGNKLFFLKRTSLTPCLEAAIVIRL